MKTDFIKVNNRELKIFDHAGGNKGVILGVHGLSGNGYSLEYFIQEFKEDYRFITLDLYGRGDSKENGSETNLFQHAKDLLGLIDALDLEDVILLGYSMGAYISSIVASKTTKVKKVILLDGFATMSEHQRPIIEPSLGRLSKPYVSKAAYIEEMTAAYAAFNIPDRPELRTLLAYELEEQTNHWVNKGSEEVVRKDWASFWSVPILEVGQAIKQPVLLVIALGEIGENPPLFLPKHYDEAKEAIQNLSVVTTEANHYTMGFEPRPDINQSISDFLRD